MTPDENVGTDPAAVTPRRVVGRAWMSRPPLAVPALSAVDAPGAPRSGSRGSRTARLALQTLSTRRFPSSLTRIVSRNSRERINAGIQRDLW